MLPLQAQGIREDSDLQRNKSKLWLVKVANLFSGHVQFSYHWDNQKYLLSLIKTFVEAISNIWRSTSTEGLLLYFLLIVAALSIFVQTQNERIPCLK